METTTSVELTQESFKKAAQRLHKHFADRPVGLGAKGSDLKLSEVQEALAKSLSFRSLHDAWAKLPEKPKRMGLKTKSEPSESHGNSMFASASALGQILMELLPEQGESMWRARAISLISAASTVLEAKIKAKGGVCDSKSFGLQLELRTLADDVRDEALPSHARAVAGAYLKSLPGYGDGKDLMDLVVVRDQHAYLHMQIQRPLEWMGQIEARDVVLFSPDWICSDDEKDGYKQAVKQIENIEWSWLYHPVFKEVVDARLASGVRKQLKASDLLRLQSQSFMPGRNMELKSLLETLFARYASAIELSKKIQVASGS